MSILTGTLSVKPSLADTSFIREHFTKEEMRRIFSRTLNYYREERNYTCILILEAHTDLVYSPSMHHAIDSSGTARMALVEYWRELHRSKIWWNEPVECPNSHRARLNALQDQVDEYSRIPNLS
jgi:hypothetical protein